MTSAPEMSEDSPRTARKSDEFRANASNCAELAEAAAEGPAYRRYKRMEAAWLALAEEQDWLDGERPSLDPARNMSEIQSRR